MKVVSLFTGCGGLDLGLHQAGHEIILQCECDPGAQQVLKKAFPGTLLVPDVCGLQCLPKETELVAAGFPCIDVSRAGLRQGLEGPSTGLVKHVIRLLKRARDDERPVPWVLLENVEALLDRCHGGPPPISWIVGQLEELGYRSWAHRIVCSAGFGVPNRRKRIFLVASMHGDARDVLLGQGLQRCMGSCVAAVGGDCWECFNPDDSRFGAVRKADFAIQHCSYALDLGNARSSAGVDVVPTFTTCNARLCLLLSNGRYGGLRIEDAERLQGLPPGHTAPCFPLALPGIRQHRNTPRDCNVETQEKARFALLGNAVTVQVARWLGERLMDPYRYKYYPTENDMPMVKDLQPSGLPESTWEELREIRLDHLKASGAVGGQGQMLRTYTTPAVQPSTPAATAGEAAAAAAAASGSDSDEQKQEQVQDAAQAAEQGLQGPGTAGGQGQQAGVQQADQEQKEQGLITEELQQDTDATQEAGTEAGAQAGAEAGAQAGAQAGAEAGAQAGEPAGAEAGAEAGTEAGAEAGAEASAEASAEAGAEAADRADGEARAGAASERTGEAQRASSAAPGQLTLVTKERYASGRLSNGWPRAAWFLAGHGRWGLKQASDTPVKGRFVRLGEFIKRVGPPPSDVALVTYLQRLKEQGWDVARTERKMMMCGVQGLGEPARGGGLLGGVKANKGLAGLLHGTPAETSKAASSIGRLVWGSVPLTTPVKAVTAAVSGATAAAGSSASAAAAATATVAWWPCEAIDPFDPPQGFKLLPEHKLELTPEERKLYLPDDKAAGAAAAVCGDGDSDGDGQPGAASGGAEAAKAPLVPPAPDHNAEQAAAAAAASEAPAAGEAPGAAPAVPAADEPAAAAADGGVDGAAQPPGRKKVLLIWFHTSQFEWRDEAELLPFQEHKELLKAEALALIEAGRLSRPQEWHSAYREAKHCNTILIRAAKLHARQQQLVGLAGPAAAQMAAADLSSDGGDSSDDPIDDDHRAAVAGRAAKQALAVNLKMPRCKRCEACTQTTGDSRARRCLLVRATAAAAAGHTGAQLAVLADKAVGADVEVWWPLDQAWYKGLITGYDNLRVRHTISYEDGDIEIIPLWAPQQRIRLRSQPAQWVAKAAQLAADKATKDRDLDAARASARVAGAAPLPDPANLTALTALEQERADNISRNKAMMAHLMGSAAAGPAAAAARGSPAPVTPALAAAAAVADAGGAAGAAPRARAGRGKARVAPDMLPFSEVEELVAAFGDDDDGTPPPVAKKARRKKVGGGGGGGRGKSKARASSDRAFNPGGSAKEAAAAAQAMAAAAAMVGCDPAAALLLGKRTAACVAEMRIKDQAEQLTLHKKPKAAGAGPPGVA